MNTTDTVATYGDLLAACRVPRAKAYIYLPGSDRGEQRETLTKLRGLFPAAVLGPGALPEYDVALTIELADLTVMVTFEKKAVADEVREITTTQTVHVIAGEIF